MSERLRLKYVTGGCLLLINPNGKLRVLYTPFRVLCIKESFGIPTNAWVYVEAIFHHPEFKISYLIHGNIHPYHCFRVCIAF